MSKYFKLGCNWGKDKPDFFEMIRAKRIVVGESNKRYDENDFVLVTQGYTARAIVRVKARVVSISRPDLKEDFDKYGISYNEDVDIYNGEWLEIEDGDRFKYELQQGIVSIQKGEIIQKIVSLSLLSKTDISFSSLKAA